MPIWVVVAKFNSSEVLSIRISFNENLLNSLYLLNRCPFGRIDDPDIWHGFKAKRSPFLGLQPLGSMFLEAKI